MVAVDLKALLWVIHEYDIILIKSCLNHIRAQLQVFYPSVPSSLYSGKTFNKLLSYTRRMKSLIACYVLV